MSYSKEIDLCRLTKYFLSMEDLLKEFPDLKNKLQELKGSDAKFKNLVDEYYEVNISIHNLEIGAIQTSTEKLNELLLKKILLRNKLADYSSLE